MNRFFIVSLFMLTTALTAAEANLPEFPVIEFSYDCVLEVSLNDTSDLSGAFLKNYQKHFRIENLTNSDPDSLLFSFSSASENWSHYCENCNGFYDDKYMGQKFASDVVVNLAILPPVFGVATASIEYKTPQGYSVEAEYELFSYDLDGTAALPNQLSVKFPDVSTPGPLLSSNLFCRENSSK